MNALYVIIVCHIDMQETVDDSGEIADQEGERLNQLTEAELLRMYEGVNTVDVRR